MPGSEEVREALLSLQLENDRLRTEAAHARLQLRSLEALLRTDINEDPFPGVFDSLHSVFEFEQALVLIEGDTTNLDCVSATPPDLIGMEWPSGPFLEKVMKGRVCATFSNADLAEWKSLKCDRLTPDQPAMYLPISVRGRRGVVVLLREAGKAGFAREHVALAREFSLLTSYAFGALHASQIIESSRARAVAAEEASRAKNLFIAKMSHELRTPLNAVIGFSELMKDEAFGELGNEQYRDFAGHIHESGTHLLAVINDIIDISRIESGAFEMNEAPFDLGGLIRSCQTIAQGWLGKMPRQLVVDVQSGLPPILGDERLFRQIVINLLSNAFKFSSDETGLVTIRAAIRNDDRLYLEVEDNGIGIPAADIPRLSEPFFQVDDSLSRSHEGTGLGLSLVRTLVEAHQGSLEIRSELGRGSCMTIVLPPSRMVDAAGEQADDPVPLAVSM